MKFVKKFSDFSKVKYKKEKKPLKQDVGISNSFVDKKGIIHLGNWNKY